jgi:catechol 2,3-dioxygenase-like lactoylglutathione lyase family enzyme
MSRVQLALNVTDVDKAVEFYRKLFGTEPAKRRPGYANFAIDEPALKLVLIEAQEGGSLNHLGVEVGSTDEVTKTTGRIQAEGLATFEEEGVACCYAVQDKVWISDPDGAPWEVYTVLADSQQMSSGEGGAGCCGSPSGAEAAGVKVNACCQPSAASIVRPGP